MLKLIKFTGLECMYNGLLRRSTAKGFSTGLVPVGPTKVKACKSILFIEGIPEVEIKMKWNVMPLLGVKEWENILRPSLKFFALIATL